VLGSTLRELRNSGSLNGQKPLRSLGLGTRSNAGFLFVGAPMSAEERESEQTTESKRVLEERFDETDVWLDISLEEGKLRNKSLTSSSFTIL